ncbi:MAG: hypothetical protein JXQ76_02225, partial [Campylobacterales bacterium]|nr:hypothetical protein [Campylobacterales bacterium]
DEHLSLIEMEALGLDSNDGIFSNQTFVEMIKTIGENFPQARKIFEVKPEYAFKHFELLKSKMV